MTKKARISKQAIAVWEAHVLLVDAIAAARALDHGPLERGLTESVIAGHLAPTTEPGMYTLTDLGREVVEAMKK